MVCGRDRGVCPAGAAQRVCGRGGRRGGDSAFRRYRDVSFGDYAASISLLHPGDLRDVWLCEDDEAGKGNGNSHHPVRPVDAVESLLISGKYMIEMKRPSAGRISCPAKGRCYLL